jgi:hypothetical protein
MILIIRYLLMKCIKLALNHWNPAGNLMKKSLLILSTFVLYACGSGDNIELVAIGSDTEPPVTLERSTVPTAKNIILLIGDGMGPNQVALAKFATGGADHRLSFENFPITGLSTITLQTVFILIQQLQPQPGQQESKQKIGTWQLTLRRNFFQLFQSY